MSEAMGLRESLARIARALEGLLEVASGYKVRRDVTSREAAFMSGRPMDPPAERLTGPSETEMNDQRQKAVQRQSMPGGGRF